ncbi:MAG: HIT family protein [Ignavibacteriales bacterium]|nr:HIT family protein [Ignavibacteriales bacterium]
MKCIFCDIINRDLPAEVLYEDEQVISFLDIRPMNYGHALIVPKMHVENFLSLPEDQMGRVFIIAQKIACALRDALGFDGFNITINNGKAAGQTVFHLPIHIIPRYSHDTFQYKIDFKKYRNNELEEIGNSIRKCI